MSKLTSLALDKGDDQASVMEYLLSRLASLVLSKRP